MRYLYDKLRDALGGKTFKSGIVIKGWSPNEIRSIFIMRDFILVTDFVNLPKLVQLDVQEVEKDLLTPSASGSLTRLLDSRQLSCLEEIYIDEGFRNYPNVINLEGYVRGMFNSASRLRYYGYVRGFNATQLHQIYSKLAIDPNSFDYTVARNMGGFEYVDTGNTLWYTKYNLRPQYYSIDADKGKLHTYFAKCEKVVSESQSKKDKQIKALEAARKIVYMFKIDLNRARDISTLLEYSKFCKNCDPFAVSIGCALQEQLIKKKVVKGLTKELFVNSCKAAKMQFGDAENFLVRIYQRVGVFDEEGKSEFELSDDELNDGIYHLGERLDMALASELSRVTEVNRTQKMAFFMLATAKIAEGLPQGKLTELLKKYSILHCEEVAPDKIEGLIEYPFRLCGMLKADFINKETVGVD